MSVTERKRVGLIVGAALLVGCVFSAPGAASADPTPTPTPSDAAQAQLGAHAAARQVADLEARVIGATRQATSANRAAAKAQSRLDGQLGLQRSAEDDVRRATVLLRRTQAIYDRDHRAFTDLVTAQYESGGGLGGAASVGRLLTARDPAELLVLQQNSEMMTQYMADIVGRDRSAAAVKQLATDRRAAALATRRAVANQLLARRADAQRALSTSNKSLATLRTDLVAARVSQDQTDSVLAHFLGGWSLADPARANALNRQYLALAEQAGSQPPTVYGHRWSAERGQWAAWRALRRIGTPYAFAGGNGAGPTTGLCTGGGAQNDCHVTGFDCSGLTIYGWAPYLDLPHLAAAQYAIAGREHPVVTDLLPGDLVFWSSNGSAAGIHHVALYVGDGNVVQAPQSGDIVRVTPLGSVDSGYFGATRPLS
ncbi:MAG: NlpC/P60 family protein [Actinomycetota bacterium]|nr:NlpC/P60 family protein [Actinomycetota bacterium]